MTIRGTEHPLCFSTRVVCDVGDKYGDLEAWAQLITGENAADKLRATMWMLAEMMRAGARYAAMQGETAPEVYTEADLLDLYSIDEIAEIHRSLFETITGGSRRDVEAELPKNA